MIKKCFLINIPLCENFRDWAEKKSLKILEKIVPIFEEQAQYIENFDEERDVKRWVIDGYTSDLKSFDTPIEKRLVSKSRLDQGLKGFEKS